MATLDQYAGADTELDPKQAPMLFRGKSETDLATVGQYLGSDTEMDPKPPTVLFRRQRDALRATATHFAGAETEIDVKNAPSLFGQRRAADPMTAAQYVRSDAEMDVKISDRRLKREIRQIGVSPSGLAIYSFRYVWGGPMFVGVMAQDLVVTRPDAVIQDVSGYLMVDYDMIDVKMTSLDSHDELLAAASAPALFARRRAADPITAAQYVRSDAEMDVKPSDRRLKREIRQIGVSPSGLAIYSFRYIWGGPMFVGVMAQDLVATRPEAVIQDVSGYLMVDYDMIDVKMTSLDSHDESLAATSAPALFARRRAADRVFGAQSIGSERSR